MHIFYCGTNKLVRSRLNVRLTNRPNRNAVFARVIFACDLVSRNDSQEYCMTFSIPPGLRRYRYIMCSLACWIDTSNGTRRPMLGSTSSDWSLSISINGRISWCEWRVVWKAEPIYQPFAIVVRKKKIRRRSQRRKCHAQIAQMHEWNNHTTDWNNWQFRWSNKL